MVNTTETVCEKDWKWRSVKSDNSILCKICRALVALKKCKSNFTLNPYLSKHVKRQFKFSTFSVTQSHTGCTRSSYYTLCSLQNLYVGSHESHWHECCLFFFCVWKQKKDDNWWYSQGETGTHTRSVIVYSTESPFITSVYPHHKTFTPTFKTCMKTSVSSSALLNRLQGRSWTLHLIN